MYAIIKYTLNGVEKTMTVVEDLNDSKEYIYAMGGTITDISYMEEEY